MAISPLGDGPLSSPCPALGGSSHLLLAISKHVPESVSPALANSGDWNRHRTWYQWVKGSVGAVDSHTVILSSRDRHVLYWAGASTLGTLSSPQVSVPSDGSSRPLAVQAIPATYPHKGTIATGSSPILTYMPRDRLGL